jgi:hypothetical protein
MFFEIHRRRLTRGADHDDAVGAFADVPVHQAAQARQIEAAVLVHGGDDGGNGALNHG